MSKVVRRPHNLDRKSDYITLSSSGFPDPNNSQDGATLHFVDTGEEYVQYQNMWELDLRRVTALKMAALNL